MVNTGVKNVQVVNDEFSEECLRSHNHFRAQHGCPPLQLSAEVSKFSQQWANQISRDDHLHHSHHSEYGENLSVTYLSDNSLQMTKGSQVVESWYSENRWYPSNGCVNKETVLKTGHFTQVIWSSSKKLGIGRAVSKSNRVYVVANYYPAGNVMNKFPVNVPKKVITRRKYDYSTRTSTNTTNSHHGFNIHKRTEHNLQFIKEKNEYPV